MPSSCWWRNVLFRNLSCTSFVMLKGALMRQFSKLWKSILKSPVYFHIYLVIDKQVPAIPAEQPTQSVDEDAQGLVDFCPFICELPVPPKQMIRIRFSTDNSQRFPVAETCFVWLVVPTTHESLRDFRKYMDIALKFEATGFHIM